MWYTLYMTIFFIMSIMSNLLLGFYLKLHVSVNESDPNQSWLVAIIFLNLLLSKKYYFWVELFIGKDQKQMCGFLN